MPRQLPPEGYLGKLWENHTDQELREWMEVFRNSPRAADIQCELRRRENRPRIATSALMNDVANMVAQVRVTINEMGAVTNTEWIAVTNTEWIPLSTVQSNAGFIGGVETYQDDGPGLDAE